MNHDFLFYFLLICVWTGRNLERKCTDTLIYVPIKMENCEIGKCMVTCGKTYEGTVFGECPNPDTCFCGIYRCILV